MTKKTTVFSGTDTQNLIKEFGNPTDIKLAKVLGVSTRTVFRMRHQGTDARQMTHLKDCLQKMKDGVIVDEKWENKPLSKEDLQFLLKIAENLSQPITLGLAFELLSKR